MSTVSWKLWLEASRPKTLTAAVVPVVVATAFAYVHGAGNAGRALVCLVFALFVQVGTNYANDYFDFVKGADTAARVGPRRTVAAGLIAPRTMLAAVWLTLGLGFAAGLVLVPRCGWFLLPVGVLSVVCAVAYTGGPFPLGYSGLGDLFVFIFFGIVAVCSTFFVQTGNVTCDVVLAATAIGLLATNILVANNYRDMETDAIAGKRTLVVRFGRGFAVVQYSFSIWFSMATVLALAAMGYRLPVLLPLLLLPQAAMLLRRFDGSCESCEEIALLGKTAKFLALYGGLLSAGVLLAGTN